MGKNDNIAKWGQNFVKPLYFRKGTLFLLDQTILPHKVKYIRYTTARQTAKAIKTMIVRGAPAIGCTAAYGVVLAARQYQHRKNYKELIYREIDALAATRPTAVNLFWALRRQRLIVEQGRTASGVAKALTLEANRILAEDIDMGRRMGEYGAKLIKTGASVLTHCNAGGLATGLVGTALAPVYAAVARGKKVKVYADETRPRLQGARLTAWELMQNGVPVTLITDNMAAYIMQLGKIDIVFVGADRIAANGDTANKIGTYSVALAARHHGIPFYVVAPTSTVDLQIRTGRQLPIEERSADEVTLVGKTRIAPRGVNVFNPAFDVTPARLVTGIITDRGVCRRPYRRSLAKVKKEEF